jgi:hypothetical protein
LVRAGAAEAADRRASLAEPSVARQPAVAAGPLAAEAAAQLRPVAAEVEAGADVAPLTSPEAAERAASARPQKAMTPAPELVDHPS